MNTWLTHINIKSGQKDLINIKKSQGIYLIDNKNKKYVNGFGGLSSIFGANIKPISREIKKQLDLLAYCPTFRTTNVAVEELTDSILEFLPKGFGKVIFATSGSEAIEGAMKVVRQFHKLNNDENKNIIYSFDKSYHGASLANIGISGLYNEETKKTYSINLNHSKFIPTPHCSNCPMNKLLQNCKVDCLNELENQLSEEKTNQVAGIVVESVLAAGGVIIPPKKYFQKLETLRKKFKFILICDESATGFGRTGKMFAYEHFDLQPDIIVLSKAINGGVLPLGLTIVKDKIFKKFYDSNANLIHGTSQSGNPTVVRAAIASIQLFRRKNLLSHINKLDPYIKNEIVELNKFPQIQEVRSIGMMFSFVIKDKNNRNNELAYKIFMKMMKKGVIFHCKENRVSFFPPLVINKKEILTVFHKLISVLQNLNE